MEGVNHNSDRRCASCI